MRLIILLVIGLGGLFFIALAPRLQPAAPSDPTVIAAEREAAVARQAAAQTAAAEQRAAAEQATAERDAAERAARLAAIQAVKDYRAPGQKVSVEMMTKLTAASATRPTVLNSWSASLGKDGWHSVYLSATVGNEAVKYWWQYDSKTGTVQARDDATKRISGW
jgi:hypothetical protein